MQENIRDTFVLSLAIGDNWVPVSTTVTKGLDTSFSTYDEELEQQEHDLYILTFSFASKLYNSGVVKWHPLLRHFFIGARLKLEWNNTEIYFIIKDVSPEDKPDNVIYNITAQDEVSYLWSRHNLGYSYTTRNDQGDIAPKQIYNIARDILRDNYLASEKAGDGLWSVVRHSSDANDPFNNSIGWDSLATQTMTLELENTNPYNALIEACNTVNAYMKVDFKNKTLDFFRKNDIKDSGYRYHPLRNLTQYSADYTGEEMCTLLHVHGGEDADGNIVTMIPPMPYSAQKYLELQKCFSMDGSANYNKNINEVLTELYNASDSSIETLIDNIKFDNWNSINKIISNEQVIDNYYKSINNTEAPIKYASSIPPEGNIENKGDLIIETNYDIIKDYYSLTTRDYNDKTALYNLTKVINSSGSGDPYYLCAPEIIYDSEKQLSLSQYIQLSTDNEGADCFNLTLDFSIVDLNSLYNLDFLPFSHYPSDSYKPLDLIELIGKYPDKYEFLTFPSKYQNDPVDYIPGKSYSAYCMDYKYYIAIGNGGLCYLHERFVCTDTNIGINTEGIPYEVKPGFPIDRYYRIAIINRLIDTSTLYGLSCDPKNGNLLAIYKTMVGKTESVPFFAQGYKTLPDFDVADDSFRSYVSVEIGPAYDAELCQLSNIYIKYDDSSNNSDLGIPKINRIAVYNGSVQGSFSNDLNTNYILNRTSKSIVPFYYMLDIDSIIAQNNNKAKQEFNILQSFITQYNTASGVEFLFNISFFKNHFSLIKNDRLVQILNRHRNLNLLSQYLIFILFNYYEQLYSYRSLLLSEAEQYSALCVTAIDSSTSEKSIKISDIQNKKKKIEQLAKKLNISDVTFKIGEDSDMHLEEEGSFIKDLYFYNLYQQYKQEYEDTLRLLSDANLTDKSYYIDKMETLKTLCVPFYKIILNSNPAPSVYELLNNSISEAIQQSTVQNKENYAKKREIITHLIQNYCLKPLYQEFGQYIYEQTYENMEELDSVSLYNQAVAYFADLNRIHSSHSAEVIDIAALEQVQAPRLTIGNYISVYNPHTMEMLPYADLLGEIEEQQELYKYYQSINNSEALLEVGDKLASLQTEIIGRYKDNTGKELTYSEIEEKLYKDILYITSIKRTLRNPLQDSLSVEQSSRYKSIISKLIKSI